MLRFTSTDLPLQASPIRHGAFFRLWSGSSRTTAPLFRFDKSRAYGESALPDDIEITVPDYGGLWYQIETFEVTLHRQMSSVTTAFQILADPFQCQPGTAWADVTHINLYADPTKSLVTGDTVVTVCDITLRLEAPANNVVAFDLTDYPNFTPTKITASGLVFNAALNPLSPVPGEFTFNDPILSLYVAAPYTPRVADEATITGLLAIELPDPAGVALTFDLGPNPPYVDGVDYLGLGFELTDDPYQVKTSEFLFDPSFPLLTVFVDQARGQRLIQIPGSLNGASFAGSTSYVQFGGDDAH